MWRLLMLFWWLPQVVCAQRLAPPIDGYLDIKWLSGPEQALAQLGGASRPVLLRLNPLRPSSGDLRGFDYAINLERLIGGRAFAVQLLFTDGQLVSVLSYTPVRPGETFVDAVADVRRSLDPGLDFKSGDPEQLSAYDAVGGILLGHYRTTKTPTQVELSYHCRDVDFLMRSFLQRLEREEAAKDSVREATIRRFERDYATGFGGDDRTPTELLHGRKTAVVVRKPPPPPTEPFVPPKAVRKPTPAQRRQQAARRAWWRRHLGVSRKTTVHQ